MCEILTKSGKQCQGKNLRGQTYCVRHKPIQDKNIENNSEIKLTNIAPEVSNSEMPPQYTNTYKPQDETTLNNPSKHKIKFDLDDDPEGFICDIDIDIRKTFRLPDAYEHKDDKLITLIRENWFNSCDNLYKLSGYFRRKPHTKQQFELQTYLVILDFKLGDWFSLQRAQLDWNAWTGKPWVSKFGLSDIKRIAAGHNPDAYKAWKLEFEPEAPKEQPKQNHSNKLTIEWPKIDSMISGQQIPAIFDRYNQSCFAECTKLSTITKEDLAIYLISNIAYITAGGNSYFLTRSIENGNLRYDRVSIQSMKQMITSFEVDGCSDRINLMTAIKEYISDLSYNRVDFIPYASRESYDWTNRSVFNTFTGFVHDLKPKFQIDMNLISRYLGHLRDVWASGDEDVYHALIKQFAWYVQKPFIKSQLAIVVMGQEGTGKNIVIDLLSKYVIGNQYCTETSKMDKIVGRFNSALENKLICVLNEASDCSSKESLANQDKLKDLITNQNIVIERKGQEPYTISDRCNYIAFSNNRYVIKASSQMRRFAMIESSDCRMGDHDHFQEMIKDFETHGAGEHLYHYLMSIDINSYIPQRDFPQTDFKKQIQSDAIVHDGQWLIAYCNDELQNTPMKDHCPKEGFNPTSYLLHRFQNWLSDNGYQSKTNVDKLAKFLNRLGLESSRPRINGIKVRGFKLDKDDLKIKLKAYYRQDDLFE